MKLDEKIEDTRKVVTENKIESSKVFERMEKLINDLEKAMMNSMAIRDKTNTLREKPTVQPTGRTPSPPPSSEPSVTQDWTNMEEDSTDQNNLTKQLDSQINSSGTWNLRNLSPFHGQKRWPNN